MRRQKEEWEQASTISACSNSPLGGRQRVIYD